MAEKFSRVLSITLLVVLGLAIPAELRAQTAAPQTRCTGTPDIAWDVQIDGCTAAIRSGRYVGKDLSSIYNSRGIAWRAKGDLDRAMADYDDAIRLDPTYANAYNNRGNGRRASGDFDRAIADYDQAIRLDPKLAAAYNNRGGARGIKGDFNGAIADFDQAIRLKFAAAYIGRGRVHFWQGDFPAAAADLLAANDLKYVGRAVPWNRNNADALLWHFLARGRMGQDGASELSANAARLESRDWPYPVIDFYLGRRTLEAMRAAAGDSGEKCEAAFYAGEWHLLRGDKSAAKEELESATRTCKKTWIEYVGAVAELARLAP